MISGIERAPVFPSIPSDPMTDAQVESYNAFLSMQEHRELIQESLGLGTDRAYRLSAADLEARRRQQESARIVGHHQTRSTSELGKLITATVSQLEDEFRRKSVLDIGAGAGRFGEAIARNAKADVTFLDRDPEIMERISRRAGRIVLGDGRELPFDDESFDRVFSAYSSVHWAETPVDSVKALNEAIRVTKVGGAAILIPILNSVSQTRRLLPAVLKARKPDGSFKDIDRFAVVWAMRDAAILDSLFKLAQDGYGDITWSNFVEPTPVRGISREIYSAVIDKLKPIPSDFYAQNIESAQEMIDE